MTRAERRRETGETGKNFFDSFWGDCNFPFASRGIAFIREISPEQLASQPLEPEELGVQAESLGLPTQAVVAGWELLLSGWLVLRIDLTKGVPRHLLWLRRLLGGSSSPTAIGDIVYMAFSPMEGESGEGEEAKIILKKGALGGTEILGVTLEREDCIVVFTPPKERKEERIAVKVVGKHGSELSLEERRKRVLELLGESGLSGWAAEGFGENGGELTIFPSGCDSSSFLGALFLRKVTKSSSGTVILPERIRCVS